MAVFFENHTHNFKDLQLTDIKIPSLGTTISLSPSSTSFTVVTSTYVGLPFLRATYGHKV